MATLIIYYSRTGNTKHIAEMLAKELNADTEALVDKADRKGIIGYFKAGFQASKGRQTDIENLQKDLNNYDTLVIGQPVWAWTMVPAIRALLTRHTIDKHKVALFCTMGGSGHEKCFEETMKMMPGTKVIATQAFINPLRLKAQTDKLISDLVQKIKDANHIDEVPMPLPAVPEMMAAPIPKPKRARPKPRKKAKPKKAKPVKRKTAIKKRPAKRR